MPKALLVTRPNHDEITNYLSAWCKKSVDFARSRGMTVIDLDGNKATRAQFESYNSSVAPSFIIFNGHGSSEAVTGHNNLPIVSTDSNVGQLKSRIIYSISCSSAAGLGRGSIAAGAISYIGYLKPFWFIYDKNSATRPLQDVEAKVFFEHSELFINLLIKGHTINDAYGRAKKNLEANYAKALSSDGGESDAAALLLWDLTHFDAQGDLNASI